MKNYFNFTDFGNKMLLTNEVGNYVFLSKYEFKQLIKDNIDYNSKLGKELIEKNFIYKGAKQDFLESYINKLRISKCHLLQGTSLHIFVLTNSCNLQCIYCQAQSGEDMNSGKMTLEIAEKAVDFALQSPCKNLTFEFQGGEPLLNFDTLKYIVEYADAHKGERHIDYTLVSNLTYLDKEILRYIKEKNIGVSTSLDGHEFIHNANRPFRGGGKTYNLVIEKINLLRKNGIYVGAIQTTSRNSLAFAKEIVDAYVNNKLEYIFIRPLTPLGCASYKWKQIGYDPEQFVDFYKNCLEYIVDINKKGKRLVEGHAAILLKKILEVSGENYMELHSPCGGTIGQIAYYYDGDIYTCDEGRMLGEMGNDSFKLGNVFKSKYEDVICSEKCKAVMSASFIEALPECCDCVYHPYCGNCPVLNLALNQDIYPRTVNNYKCKIYKGILNTIFEYLYTEDKDIINIFMSWIH